MSTSTDSENSLQPSSAAGAQAGHPSSAAGPVSPSAASPDTARHVRPHVLTQLRLAFGFFTVLPLSASAGLADICRAGYLLPAVAVILGLLEAAVAASAGRLLTPLPGAGIALAAALMLTGFHHADGLADVGDALMAHGRPARRIEVMKDRDTGTGALLAVMLTYLITWGALTQVMSNDDITAVLTPGNLLRLAGLLIAAEVSSRLCLLVNVAAGRPSHNGSGSAFLKEMKGWRVNAALVASAAVLAGLSLMLDNLAPAAAGLGAAGVGLIIAAVARKEFGGTGGDVLGASVELGRMAALLAMVAVLAG